MSRLLTTKDRAYLGQLAVRNLTEEPADPTTGQGTPMSPAERMRRWQIRHKAEKAIQDLLLADAAGVIDLAKKLEDSELGLSMASAEDLQDGDVMAEGTDREDLFYRLLGWPSDDASMDL